MNDLQSDKRRPVCLTIAGLDPSGGAGIIADIKTFSAFGCFATAAISSVTFQNTTGVFGAVHQTPESIRKQIEPLLDDYEIAAIKIGMLPTRAIVEEVARVIKERRLKNIVVDPVIRSTSGFDLIDDEALTALIEKLFPLADLITPNIAEAERIAGLKINLQEDITDAAKMIRSLGAKNILIKGGHFEEKVKSKKATDYLFIDKEMHVFESDRIETVAMRGTGCTLASAIAANLSLGKSSVEAVGLAKNFVMEAIRADWSAGILPAYVAKWR